MPATISLVFFFYSLIKTILPHIEYVARYLFKNYSKLRLLGNTSRRAYRRTSLPQIIIISVISILMVLVDFNIRKDVYLNHKFILNVKRGVRF